MDIAEEDMKLVCAREEDVDEGSIQGHMIGCVVNLIKTEDQGLSFQHFELYDEEYDQMLFAG